MNDDINPQFTDIYGLRFRYASGAASTGRAVLLTSPWPESIVAFREIWPVLATAAPLVAIDLPGFGQSRSRPEVMNPRAMGDFLIKVLEAFSLDRPHALSPDVGTSAALYAAATHENLFSSLIGGGGAMDESLVAGTLKESSRRPIRRRSKASMVRTSSPVRSGASERRRRRRKNCGTTASRMRATVS
jgi:pimeloyl-ACP methyl ester carboxylesterase